MSSVDVEKPGPKRRRETKSCAECRRSSELVPDRHCQRLVEGKPIGLSTILVSTEELHRRNEQLSARVRELETALATLQASSSDKPHPLLSDELLLLKLPPGVAVNMTAVNGSAITKEEDEDENIAEAFGTLHISIDGSGSFYGASATSELLMQDAECPVVPAEDELPVNLLLLSTQFPFNNVTSGSTYLLVQMRSLLPPLQDAWRLCELYFDNAAWLYRPFSRSDFIDLVISPVYEKKGTSPISGAQLSLLYITMAIGILVDPYVPAYSVTARRYQCLARASLAIENVMVDTSLIALYSIFGLCYYLQSSDEKDAMAECIVFQGIMVKIAQSMGLHRDPEYFKLSDIPVQRRRRVFWEIYLYDMWQSVVVGRPPGMSSTHIDTKIPTYPEDGDDPKGYHQTKIEFGQEYLRPFLDDAFSGSRNPKYKRVLELDKDLRTRCVYSKELLVPGLDAAAEIDGKKPTLAKTMQRHALYMIREVLLFYLHRAYFARAFDGGGDPLESDFAPSVLAIYRSACGILGCVRSAFVGEREATIRLSWFWSHAASSAVIFAAVVTLAPGSILATPALLELDQACGLFQQAPYNRRVARFMPTVQKLQSNAHETILRWKAGQSTRGIVQDLQELSAMAGATRLICKATQTPIFTSSIQQPVSASTDASDAEPPEYCIDAQTGRVLHFEGAHSSLIEFYARLHQQSTAMDMVGMFDFAPSESANGPAQASDILLQPIHAEIYPELTQGAQLQTDGLIAEGGFVTQSAHMDWAQMMELLGLHLS